MQPWLLELRLSKHLYYSNPLPWSLRKHFCSVQFPNFQNYPAHIRNSETANQFWNCAATLVHSEIVQEARAQGQGGSNWWAESHAAPSRTWTGSCSLLLRGSLFKSYTIFCSLPSEVFLLVLIGIAFLQHFKPLSLIINACVSCSHHCYVWSLLYLYWNFKIARTFWNWFAISNFRSKAYTVGWKIFMFWLFVHFIFATWKSGGKVLPCISRT